jgi:hypothetical protein
LAIFLIFAVISGIPINPAVAFKGQNMGGNTVQEPAIMRNDNNRTTEV